MSFHSDRTRAARFVKTHPHTLLQEYDVAVWIDSNIMILGDLDPLIRQVMASDVALGAIPHPSRKSIYDEIVSCSNRGKDEISVMRNRSRNTGANLFLIPTLSKAIFLSSIFDTPRSRIFSTPGGARSICTAGVTN